MEGNKCLFHAEELKNCSLIACNLTPVDGEWTHWTPSGQCSKSCGTGYQIYLRECSNPAPKNGGKACNGNHGKISACHLLECAGQSEWLPWSQWSDCSSECDVGMETRMRQCKVENLKYCVGKNIYSRICRGKCRQNITSPTTSQKRNNLFTNLTLTKFRKIPIRMINLDRHKWIDSSSLHMLSGIIALPIAVYVILIVWAYLEDILFNFLLIKKRGKKRKTAKNEKRRKTTKNNEKRKTTEKEKQRKTIKKKDGDVYQ